MAAILLVRCVLAAVFLVAGIAKFADPQGAEKALKDFGLPLLLVNPLRIGLPLVETLVGISLLLSFLTFWGAIGALLLLLAFTIMIGMLLARGKHPRCHCFGTLHSAPIGGTTLARNGLLLLGALLILSQGPTRLAESSLLDLVPALHTAITALWGAGLPTSLLSMLVVQCLALGGLSWIVSRLIRQDRHEPPPLELVALRPHG